MNTNAKFNSNETRETIKLGIDAHAKLYYVARQLDGATPQPVQKMTFSGLLRFVGKQKGLFRNLYTSYEGRTPIGGGDDGGASSQPQSG